MSKPIVLVIAAHPDDEALGCGGTMARYANQGSSVHVLFVADGVSSREGARATAELDERRASAKRACASLGARAPVFLDHPDQRLDGVGLLRLIQDIERVSREVEPQVVLTHHAHDLNNDHRLVAQAVLTAFRPVPGQTVRSIFGFEVLSSTEWNYASPVQSFVPSRFVDIADTFAKKLEAVKAYDREMRAAPHARSYRAVEALAVLRGASVGLAHAEAFTVYRDIVT
jgi:LmbE family N-acetylglucosaminyl deacetylase